MPLLYNFYECYHTMKKVKYIIIGLLILTAILYLYWLMSGRFQESTDNAYTQTDITNISSQINERVKISYLKDNIRVKKGALLVVLDDSQWVVALDKSEANVSQLLAAMANAKANYQMQEASLKEYSAEILAQQATSNNAHQQLSRYRQLISKNYVSKGDLDTSVMNDSVATANTTSAEAKLKTQQAKLLVLQTAITQAQANLQQGQAELEQAKLQLSYTRIYAPIAGTISNRSVQPGMMLQAGQTIASMVSDERPWVVANFKETQTGQIQRGQRVDISIDSNDGRTYAGHVESKAPATGSTFSLLPTDNATGNFTKVVQRVPVKITFDDQVSVPAGLSCEVTVHLH